MLMSALLFLSTVGVYEAHSVPVESLRIVSSFGSRVDPITGRASFHKGVDIAAQRGETIRALHPGTVVFSGKYRGYGSLVVIAHGAGVTSHYAHLNTRFVQIGDLVERGTALGTVGTSGRSTGPHLHLEVRVKGKPIDPRPLL